VDIGEFAQTILSFVDVAYKSCGLGALLLFTCDIHSLDLVLLPTIALVISVVKAPLTVDGQSLLKDGNKNNAISFKVARNGLNGLKGTDADLIQFSKLFKTLYRGRSVRHRRHKGAREPLFLKGTLGYY